MIFLDRDDLYEELETHQVAGVAGVEPGRVRVRVRVRS